MCATSHIHLIPLDMIIPIIFGKEHKLWSYLSCSFLQPPIALSLLGTNILLSSLFSNAFYYVLPLISKIKFHTHTKQHVQLLLYILMFKSLDSRWEDKRFWTEW
jgi:hypothetical protein